MLRRFTINDEGYLVDRDGYSLGQVAGITLNMPSGGKGASSSVLGGLPQTKKDSPLAPGVDEVWAHWVVKREEIGRPVRGVNVENPGHPSPSVGRMIAKGLKEVDGKAGDLMRAIDGLFEWMKARGGNPDLSRILRSYPGGRPLGEQIEFFIVQSGDAGAHGASGSITPEEMVKINRLKETVISGHLKPHRKEEVEAAISELASKGWTVEGAGEEGAVPRFLAP